MSTALKIRDDAVIALTPATDLSAGRGKGVTIAGDKPYFRRINA